MTSRWRWLLGILTRRLWFRATVISCLSVAAAFLSLVLAPFLPDGISASIGAESVGAVLTIIASSMLAVTTFSLSTMVSAYSGATANVTPRATKLLIEDTTAQNVLGTFVGSFLYSLVALIMLSTGVYGERGRVVLFIVTVAVVLLIVGTLLRWIDYLLRFGRVGETTSAVEHAAAEALEARHANQFLGGAAIDAGNRAPQDGTPILPDSVGYVVHVDMAALEQAAEEFETRVWLKAVPGAFMDPGRPLAVVPAELDDEGMARFRDAFTLAEERSFDQDPRFGLCVLAEVASRALSQAFNDSGTVIDVIGRSVRVLLIWTGDPRPEEPLYPHVFVPAIEPGELFDDIFNPIARDGAGLVEVQVRLQKAFAALARSGDERFRAEAVRHSMLALRRCEKAMTDEADLERVRAAAAALS